MTNVEQLKRDFAALQLELLMPLALTDRQWEVIAAIRDNPNDPDVWDAFLEAAPFSIARFKPEKRDEILAYCAAQTEVIKHRIPDINGSDYVQYLAESYQQDIHDISTTLFGEGILIEKTECWAGCFTDKKEQRLHGDTDRFARIMVLARIGHHFEAIDGSVAQNRPDLQSVFANAAELGEDGDSARNWLRRQQHLKPYSQDEVAIMIMARDPTPTFEQPKPTATLHCSMKIPDTLGILSALFRAYINTQRLPLSKLAA